MAVVTVCAGLAQVSEGPAFTLGLLTVNPTPAGAERVCTGYLGESLQLLAAPEAEADTIGDVMEGDHVTFAHEPQGDWQYVTVTSGQAVIPQSDGWVYLPDGINCTEFSG
ncbi:DUF4453 domain-containing protein [Rhodophyticola sp. CCM32]|uniref:DUF4453 domain-containing protein n=1 Tax=Rhodophyticola sp. CCM32 TaxID=2916397 RepID=UPI00143DDB27|nr:DUF4453 domain-containing protein [Rhodophyticola sp. CCM32]